MAQNTRIGREGVHVTAAEGSTSIELTFLGEPGEMRFRMIIEELKGRGYRPRQGRMLEGSQTALPVNLPDGEVVNDNTLAAVGDILDKAFGVTRRDKAA